MDEAILITGMGLESPWGSTGCSVADWLGLPGHCGGCDSCGLGANGCLSSTVVPRPMPVKGSRFSDFTSRFLGDCAAMALARAGLPPGQRLGDSWGVAVGTTLSAVDTIIEFDTAALRLGMSGVRPVSFPNTVINAPVGRLAITFGIRGFNATLGAGELCGIDAMAYAVNSLRRRRAGGCITGSVQVMPRYFPASSAGLPVDVGVARAGALLVFETVQAARQRRARALAGISAASSIFLPAGMNRGRLISTALKAVLAQAGLGPGLVDLVVAVGPREAMGRDRTDELIEAFFSESATPFVALDTATSPLPDAASSLAVAAATARLASGTGLENALVCGWSKFGHACFLVVSRAAGKMACEGARESLGAGGAGESSWVAAAGRGWGDSAWRARQGGESRGRLGRWAKGA